MVHLTLQKYFKMWVHLTLLSSLLLLTGGCCWSVSEKMSVCWCNYFVHNDPHYHRTLPGHVLPNIQHTNTTLVMPQRYNTQLDPKGGGGSGRRLNTTQHNTGAALCRSTSLLQPPYFLMFKPNTGHSRYTSSSARPRLVICWWPFTVLPLLHC